MSKDTGAKGWPILCDTLAIVFVVLKLCHVIDWSWWRVLSPLWIGTAAVVLMYVIIKLIVK